MKTNREVATAFINGETAHNYNTSTDGVLYWSYATPIARKVGGVILMDSRYYSNTTSHHESHITSANTYRGRWENYKIIRVPSIYGDHRENMEYLLTQVAQAHTRTLKARKDTTRARWEYLEAIAANALNSYITAFSL